MTNGNTVVASGDCSVVGLPATARKLLRSSSFSKERKKLCWNGLEAAFYFTLKELVELSRSEVN
jgi:hypothetical protein